MRLPTLLTLSFAIAPLAAQGHDDLRAEIRKIIREELRAAMQELHAPAKAAPEAAKATVGMAIPHTFTWVGEAGMSAQQKAEMVKVAEQAVKGLKVEGKPMVFRLQADKKAGPDQPFFVSSMGPATMTTKQAGKHIVVKADADAQCPQVCEVVCEVKCDQPTAKAAECKILTVTSECCEAVKACEEACEAAKACEEACEAVKAAEKCEAGCEGACTECVAEAKPTVAAKPAKQAKKAKQDGKQKGKKAKQDKKNKAKATETETFELKIG